MAKCRAAIWFSVLAITANFSLTSASPTKQCLQCICEASSGCKPNIRCHNSGNGQYLCGPYQISWAYWADAGKPGSTGFSNDFENCVVDKNCASATVRGYMALHASDCDQNGEINCLDYAAIHMTGPGGCNQRWLFNSKYWSDFNRCYAGSSSSTNRAISFKPPFPISAPSHSSSASSFRAGGNPSSTIIEIPKPLPPLTRPVSTVSSHSSAVSTSSASFGPSFSSFTSSSSFSRHNFSHSEVEISEIVTSSSSSSSSSPSSRFPSFPRADDNPFTSVPSPPTFPRPNPPSPLTPPRATPLPPLPVPPPSNKPLATHPMLFQSLPRPPGNFTPIVPDECLECLCQASSQCNLNKGCDGVFCGPYQLSWGYWADSGSPGSGANYAQCSTDRSCSETAIQGYINRWKKDCNGDGQINCDDFALINKLGPHACGKVKAIQLTDYWKQYTKCRGNKVDRESPAVIPSLSSNSLPGATSNRFPNSLTPEIEMEEQPLLSSRPTSVPDNSEVRISFNNREIVNTHKPLASSVVPPATVHNRPLTAPRQPSVPLLASRLEEPLPGTHGDNVNIISNSPLSRPTFASPDASHVPSTNHLPSSPQHFKPPSTEAPFVEVSPRSNAGLSFSSRASEPPIGTPLSPVSTNPTTDSSARLAHHHLPDSGRTEVRSANNFNISTPNSVVTQDCLECICHASSRCNNAAGCVSDGRGQFVCGPYQADWEYWTEAGKPGQRSDLSNLENFQQCLNSRDCADETVKNYLLKFRKDCDQNGVVDCNDMAAIHIAGPNNCNAQWYLDSQYYADFRNCFDFRRR